MCVCAYKTDNRRRDMTGNVCVSCVAFALHTNRPVKLLLVSGRSRCLFLCSRSCVCVFVCCACVRRTRCTTTEMVCVCVHVYHNSIIIIIYLCTYILILTCSLTYSLTRRARYLIGGIYLESRRRCRWCRCRCVQCARTPRLFAFSIIYYIIVLRNTSLL